MLQSIDWDLFWDKELDKKSPPQLTDEMIDCAERTLNHKLPSSYIELLKTHNGGYPINSYFQINGNSHNALNSVKYVDIVKIFGVGTDDGIDSKYGSEYMIREWGYPNIGILICECMSGGHDSVFLDYSECGVSGEPRVVHIDLEMDVEPVITVLANNFEEFILGLIYEKDGEHEEGNIEILSDNELTLINERRRHFGLPPIDKYRNECKEDDGIGLSNVETLWEDFLSEEKLKQLNSEELDKVNKRRECAGLPPIVAYE